MKNIIKGVRSQWKTYLISLIIPLSIGGLSALLTKNNANLNEIAKPDITPPSWVFPAVWTILFILMGIGSALVYLSDASQNKKSSALGTYVIQLIFNFFWSIWFFNMHAFLFSFVWLAVLWLLILLMTVRFYKISKPAGILQIPYLLWVTFAGYLNFAVYLMNR